MTTLHSDRMITQQMKRKWNKQVRISENNSSVDNIYRWWTTINIKLIELTDIFNWMNFKFNKIRRTTNRLRWSEGMNRPIRSMKSTEMKLTKIDHICVINNINLCFLPDVLECIGTQQKNNIKSIGNVIYDINLEHSGK